MKHQTTLCLNIPLSDNLTMGGVGDFLKKGGGKRESQNSKDGVKENESVISQTNSDDRVHYTPKSNAVRCAALEDKINVLEEHNIILQGKVKELSDNLARINRFLDIDDSHRPITSLKSHHPKAELSKIGSSMHFFDIKESGITVDPTSWKYRDSHRALITGLFNNPNSIIRIQQLQERSVNQRKVYPVNIYFNSEWNRNQAAQDLRYWCKSNGKRAPSIQFALTGLPDVQRDVKWVSTILRQFKTEELIAGYSITNFTMLENNTIVPMYTIKLTSDSSWSKDADSKTMEAFQTGKTFKADENGHSASYVHLKSKIADHILDIQAKEASAATNTVTNPTSDSNYTNRTSAIPNPEASIYDNNMDISNLDVMKSPRSRNKRSLPSKSNEASKRERKISPPLQNRHIQQPLPLSPPANNYPTTHPTPAVTMPHHPTIQYPHLYPAPIIHPSTAAGIIPSYTTQHQPIINTTHQIPSPHSQHMQTTIHQIPYPAQRYEGHVAWSNGQNTPYPPTTHLSGHDGNSHT